MTYPEFHPVDTLATPHQLLLVLLHGFGANAEALAPMAAYLELTDQPNAMQMVFPDGPFPYPASGGRMWYDIPNNYGFGQPLLASQQQELLMSRTQLREWLHSLEGEFGIPLARTILAGFSQGGAMTLDVGMRLPLAGLMVLSGYSHDDFADCALPLPPILLVHGRFDRVVPLPVAHQSRDRLQAVGANVQYHELDIDHGIYLNVLELMQTFTRDILTSLEKDME
ncbi:MAG: alpha/beta hydrolase [Cyanothece sp. SIO2G6]|nr:alpha/beta hydrolase [Cyanothece sp. SIO2G6]